MFGTTCIYDELNRFKRSAASAARESKEKQGISDSQPGLIQVIIYNFDANISSQNDKQSNYSLAMLATQLEGTTDKSDVVEQITKRIEFDKMYTSIDYKVDVQMYTGPNNPNIPHYLSRRSVPSLKH